MRFKCSECGRTMITQGKVLPGDSVTCPFCGKVTIHREVVSARPVAPTVAASASAPSPNVSGLGIPKQAPQRKLSPPKSAATEKASPGNGGGRGLVLFLSGLLVAGVAFWACREFFSKKSTPNEAKPVAVETPDAKSDAAERERARKEAEQARRREREEKAEQERLARQQERERRAKEREAELAEKQRQAAEALERREAFRRASNAFANKPGYFVVGAKNADVEDPRKGGKDLTFWAIDKTFHESGVIYEIKTGKDGLASVVAVAENAPAREIDVEEFVKRLDSGVWAIASAESVWFFNTGKQTRTAEIPDSGDDLYLLGDELADVLPAVAALKIQLPEVRYRLTLKSKVKNGDDLSLGVVQGTERVSSDSIRKVVRAKLVEQRSAKERRKLKPPKAKKFKQTVVFTDDAVGKRTVDGVTHVPRTFRYRYRHLRELNAADKKWRDLCDEAARQEERAREVEAENYAAKQAYERKVAEIENGVAVSDREVSAELGKYRLLVERSRTKVED